MEIVRVPLLNANENELELVEVMVAVGDEVQKGDVLCTVESTKATFDVEAPAAGVVREWPAREGSRVEVGALLCVLTATADEAYELGAEDAAKAAESGEFRATRKAKELAEAHGLNLSEAGLTGVVRERDVRALLGQPKAEGAQTSDEGAAGARRVRLGDLKVRKNAEQMVMYGAGGHARVLIDMIRQGRPDWEILAALDDGRTPPMDVLGVPIVGSSAELTALRQAGVRLAALGIGAVTDNARRSGLYQKLVDAGFHVPNLIHPDASVSASVTMGLGNQIFAGAVVSATVRLGDNTIINSGAVVSHDCEIGSHAHITPGAILAGNVKVGAGAVVGMGVTVYLGVTIGEGAMIANGVHIMSDVAPGEVIRASR
ncbi:hypothetical protein FRC96_04165 [Lujinxingia vulgaris]|uniref:Lipoyl-binding domain-containing protein n=1 Tax=Lujinxingia vulgaris TaxID=2600176 RepID=A0A5C6XHY5_9DELT|nr:NeuD/PglB/VioB family sugar acetyltransferase [Lujinxingia vulgaris]TXD41666.1 hypothetical protein FRC96_04165 [Lujinxingia vulgaris]